MLPTYDDEAPETGVQVTWPEGASQAKRDAHLRAERWSHALMWQVDRLHAARRQAMAGWDQVKTTARYPDELRLLFFAMDAEAHFALVAARQLLRALGAFDGDQRLPSGLTNQQVRDVRDALEHWDADGGSDAAKRLMAQGADPDVHVWWREGHGVLGDVVADSVLRQWANDVYEDLRRWDPYDGWPHTDGLPTNQHEPGD